MYKVRVYDKDGNRRYSDPLNPDDYDAAFSSFQAAERFVEWRERQNNRCVIIHEGEEWIANTAVKQHGTWLPSAQPKIIRCKDCLMHGVCRFEQGLGLNGYCSQAERREE